MELFEDDLLLPPPPKGEILDNIPLLPLPPKKIILGAEYINLATPRKPTKGQKKKIDHTIDKLNEQSDDIAKFVFQGGSGIYLPTYKEYSKTFFDIINDETKIKSDFDMFRDTSIYERYMLNSAQFSSSKSVAVNKLMKEALFDENGVRKGYSAFKRDAKEITDIVNSTWLRTEYDTSVRQAVAGQQFISYRENADVYPFWVYLETTSEHPREEHLTLVGNVYRIGSPESDEVFPPNGFNCLPKGSLILTSNGWEEIQNLQVNQAVIGGSGNKCNTTIVHKNFYNGQIYGIVKKNNIVFYTKNHRIMTIEGWKRADCINAGDIVADLCEEGNSNTMITYINNCYAFGRYIAMSFIIKWCSRMVKRFNSNIFRGDKNINPIFPTMEIMDRVKRTKEIQNDIFIPTWFSTGIYMFFWKFGVQFGSISGHFSPNFYPTSRSRNLELVRNYFKRFISFFCFTQKRMGNFSNVSSHLLSLIIFPFICIFPLGFYSLGRISNRYIQKSKNFGQNAIAFNIKFFRNSFKAFILNDIQFIEDNKDAAPFNTFYSRYNALFSFFCHNKLSVIEDVKVQNYNEYVYNITVENDNSYITKTGIVHNCSCGSEQVDDQYLSDNNKTVRTNDEAKDDLINGVPEQFRFNAADQGICCKEGHSYFQALPNANEANGETFNIE